MYICRFRRRFPRTIARPWIPQVTYNFYTNILLPHLCCSKGAVLCSTTWLIASLMLKQPNSRALKSQYTVTTWYIGYFCSNILCLLNLGIFVREISARLSCSSISFLARCPINRKVLSSFSGHLDRRWKASFSSLAGGCRSYLR